MGPAMIKIVATVHAAPAGVVLKAEDVTLVEWPSTLPLTGSFAKLDDVVGRPLLYPLGEREPVLARDVADVGAGIGLTVRIPPGMRATSVRSDEIVGVAGFLFPGSHVDILATFSVPGIPTPITQTILQKVEVLTAGQKVQPDPQGKPETVTVVTVLLNPEDSQKLLLASAQGRIQFVLRSGNDQEIVKTRAISMEELAGGPLKKTIEVVRVKPKPKVELPKPPEFYTVEIIHGDKRTTEKF
jgi:pilus assembly protein CpaB